MRTDRFQIELNDAEALLKKIFKKKGWNINGDLDNPKCLEANDNKTHLAIIYRRIPENATREDINYIFEIGHAFFLREELHFTFGYNDVLYQGDSVNILAWLDDDKVDIYALRLVEMQLSVDLIRYLASVMELE